MKTPKQMYQEHWDRLEKAMTFQEIDRVPIRFSCDLPVAKYMGVKLADLITDTERANTLVLMGTLLYGKGEIDSAGSGTWPPSREVGINMKLPGRDLPEDELWQMHEQEVMVPEDYDLIIKNGWSAWKADYAKRIGDGTTPEKLKAMGPTMGRLAKNLEAVGIVSFSPVFTSAYVETFCGYRSMENFMRDLHKIPDKVQEAMDVALAEDLENARKSIRGRANKPFAIMNGGSRSAFLSKKLFERFDLPYRMKFIDMAVEEGLFVDLHLDANWDAKIDYFKDFPKNRCVIGLDGTSDIFRAREILGDQIALSGDVPGSLLALGNPDEVYNYCIKLINEVGPKGFILSTGCGAPPNSKFDNLEAMLCAVTGK